MKNTPESKDSNPAGSVHRLVRRAKRLLLDLESEGMVLSLITGGGQPYAAIHPAAKSYECDGNCNADPEFHNLGRKGVGEMISL